jgi:hypothetical protein
MVGGSPSKDFLGPPAAFLERSIGAVARFGQAYEVEGKSH